MKIDWFKYFVVLSETMNFHKAAEILNITPQALSKSINSLEKHFKQKLFDRTNHINSITPFGKALLLKSKDILDKVEELEFLKEELEKKEPEGEIKIACSSMWQNYVLPQVFSILLEKYPKIKPQVYTMTDDEIEKNILERNIDIGLVSYNSNNDKLNFLNCYEINNVIISTKKYLEKIGQKQLNIKALDFIIPKLFNKNINTLDGWDNNNYPRKIKIEVDLLEGAINMTLAGLGVSFVPEIAVKDRIKKGDLIIIENDFYKEKEAVFIISKKSKLKTKIVEETINIINNFFSSI
ncbi:MAG: LysR family transcriptional regulator [Candidatus Sericytochromatia bacterium]